MSENMEKELEMSPEEFERFAAESAKERMKALRRKKLPENRSLENALMAMTKNELEDIKFNLDIPVPSSLKKEEMVKQLAPQILVFLRMWMTSMIEDQMALFDYLVKNDGISSGINSDDERLDYLRGIGMLFCGMDEDKLAWYMPDEIMAEYKKLSGGAFVDAVRLNSELMRLAEGLIFYYGVLDYDQLYKKVLALAEVDDLPFVDFMGVMLNGGTWSRSVVNDQHQLAAAGLMHPEELVVQQAKRVGLPYKDFPYDRVYEAGAENYIESTDDYKRLAQFFMSSCGLDVLQAADVMKGITVIIQNGYGLNEIQGMLDDSGISFSSRKDVEKFADYLKAYNNTLPQWLLKGHSPDEAASFSAPNTAGQGKRKVGRNDPCPCGSGKKYKNCCLN